MTAPSAIDRFLAAEGWAGAARQPMPGDASFRRYTRLLRGADRALLMEAPPPDDVRPFRRIALHLAALGLHPPAILAADEALGLLLIEDFGDRTFGRALGENIPPEPLYALATDTLIALHRHPDATRVAAPAYGAARMGEVLAIFPDWYWPAATGAPAPAAIRAGFDAAWAQVLPLLDRSAPTLVLRDYFVENLMWRGGQTGLAVCGLLDFQDAALGHRAYDLVSLVEDARRDVPDHVRAGMFDRYFDAFPDLDRSRFLAEAAICAAQRHARVIGLWPRLWKRDGKPRYMAHLPRTWRLFERAVAHPVLAPVKAWFEAHVPPDLRRIAAP